MAGTDDATLLARGKPDGDLYRFEGRLKELPGAVFSSVMTPIEEEAIPIAGGVGEGGIVNGLYSIHIRMLDGVDGGLTGVMLLNDGSILGGDLLTIASIDAEMRKRRIAAEHLAVARIHHATADRIVELKPDLV